jgi:hypothetical protein
MADTEWFAQGKWGAFCHYLVPPEMDAETWNRRVDGFDVKTLAAQLAEAGAHHFFLTLGQGSGHYCAPNATYDRLAGVTPSKCSRRDLMSETAEALKRHGIPMLAYVPADGSNRDPVARKGLKLERHWGDGPHDWSSGPHWAPFYQPEFQKNWEDVCRDWSLRFGDKIRGWWVDGAYAPEYRYRDDAPTNYGTFAQALRAGNPNAILAFNGGVATPVVHMTPHEDYTAGEIATALPECPGPWVARGEHKALFHILSYLGEFWCHPKPRFPEALAVGYTQHVVARGGVMTWDVPISAEGRIPAPFIQQLTAVGRGVSGQ